MSQVAQAGRPAKRRTQAERKEASVKGLVQAAISVVATRGVSAATFEAIGEEAGYHRSLVTQRFGSKKGLIDALIAHVRESFEAPLERNKLADLSGLDALLTYMNLYLTELTTNGEKRTYFMLLADAASELNDLRAVFAAEHDRVKVLLMDIIKRGQDDGSILKDIDPLSAALMVGSLQMGIAIQLLVDASMDLAAMRETSMASIRRSFENTPPRKKPAATPAAKGRGSR